MLIDPVFDFIEQLTFWKVIAYFWPFFFIDIIRYVLADMIVLIYHMPKRRREKTQRSRARARLFKEKPLISIIVPGKNEGQHIPRLAESLHHQTYQNIELVIVDDGSDDNTPHICRQLEKEGKIDRFIRNNVRGGKASAANTALRYAKGKYIVHIDADSHLAHDTIETIVLPFILDDNIGAVGGDVRVANTETSLATSLQAFEYLKAITIGRTVSSNLGILRIIAGAHGAFRRDVLERIYGWDIGPGLDGDITLKIRKLGYRVIHEPEAACYTNVPTSFSKLAKQRFRWDRSMVRFRVRKHKDIFMPSKSFTAVNFISSFENIFFNLLLNLKWWVYIIQIIIFSSQWIPVIFFINYLLYTLANLLQFIVGCLVIKDKLTKTELKLIAFLPLMPIYTGLYLRVVRTYAYLMEFVHKVSYYDPWTPWKVSRIAKKEKL